MLVISNDPSRLYEPGFDDFITYDDGRSEIKIVHALEVMSYFEPKPVDSVIAEYGFEVADYLLRIPKFAIMVVQTERYDSNYKRLPARYEKYVAKDVICAYLYATNILKCRWPEAEKYIKESSKIWELYINYFK